MNNEIRNYTQLKIAHLHNKFWAPNSVEVPDTQVILNEDFVEIDSVLRIPEQINHFKVFWVTKGISGTVCVPGQWNYAYIDGKFYHLTKGDSNGFIEGVDEEWFYYNVTYDDGQNDWMKNRVYLKGTLELTGDQELVKANLHQIPPLIENVNNRRFLNGVRVKDEDKTIRTTLLLPEKLSEHLQAKTPFTVWEKQFIDGHLKEWGEKIKANPELGVPIDEHLVLPYLFRMTPGGNGKNTVIKAIEHHAKAGFEVYDVSHGLEGDTQAGKFRNLLQNLLHSDQLFAVASRSNRTYVHARSVNPAKFVEKVDLSGCTDITLLDTVTLAKRYTLDNPAPVFNLHRFVDWVCTKQEWSSDLKEEMKKIFQEEFIKTFKGVLASGGVDQENKVFRDVTMEKIERDLVWRDAEKTNATPILNPEGLSFANTRLQGERFHKNFMWDNISKPDFIVNFKDFNEKGSSFSDEDKNKIKTITRESIEDLKHGGNGGGFNIGYQRASVRTALGSSYNNFLYLPDKYKMVSKDDTSDFLDFSYNYNDKSCMGWALMPDYDRRTFVLGFLNRGTIDIQRDTYANTLTYNPKNARHMNRIFENGRQVPVGPVHFFEVEKRKAEDVEIDWRKPSTEFLKVYKRLGRDSGVSHRKNADGGGDGKWRDQPTALRDAGAEILSRGYAFMALNSAVNNTNSEYYLKHGHGHSTKNNSSYDKTYNMSFAQRPECVYTTDKREWRRFHTEMTFPVKTETFSIIDKLREFDDIPDNFLRWEVVNTGIKKGKITKYTRSYVGAGNETTKTRDNNKPGAYRLIEEEEKKIPKNTVVAIYICLRQSYSPEGDAEFDKKAADEYRTKYGRSGESRMEALLYGLCRYYFLTPWESKGETGAIPDWIKVYGAPGYPPNGDGRSQIGLSWMKPHQGGWYVAWTRFFAPAMHHEIGFRVTDNYGNLFPLTDPKGKPSNDFIMAEIPNDYDNSGDYFARYTYRKHSSAVDRNTLLAFYYNNLQHRGVEFEITGFSDINTRELAIENLGNSTNKQNDLPNIKSITFTNNTSSPLYLISRLRPGTNKENRLGGYQGLPANKLTYEWERYLMNWKTILLEDYRKYAKRYKSTRMSNPTELPNEFFDGQKNASFTTFESEIPPFMVHYLNPEDTLSNLQHWKKNTIVKNNTERLQLYREKLQEIFRATLEMLESWGVFMKFEGTNGYANMQLNTKDMVWDFELFCDEPTVFLSRGMDKWNFVNHKEENIDVLINTRNVLNIYGSSFTLKSRKHTTDDLLDLGLNIKALQDQKQTMSAQGYQVTMKYNDQDVIEEIIETPKEMTAYTGTNYFEKEKLVRQLGLQNAEYMYRQQMIEYQKRENKINDEYEKDMSHYAWKYSVIDGALGFLTGFADMAVGGLEAITSFAGIRAPATVSGRFSNEAGTKFYAPSTGTFQTPYARWKNALQRPYTEVGDVKTHAPGNWKEKKFHANMGSEDGLANRRLGYGTMQGASTFAKGLSTVFNAGMNIGKAYDEGYTKDPRRREMFALANQKLIAEGGLVNAKHEHTRNSLLREIWELSANVAFPQLNSALVYKEHNKQRGLEDIHIVQYFPSGKLATYLSEYYKEFGYQILVRNFECTGIESIKNHLRYEFVYENNYNDITIKSMIGLRAMNGVKVIPGIQ